jgi:uncharacterized protein DUF4129
VEADRLAIRLRRRSPWEAMDLGCAMLRRWRQPVITAWLALYIPAAAALYLLIGQFGVMLFVLWWLKPLFDRPVLHVLGSAVFGTVPTVWATLRALPRTPGLIASLTVYRFDFARSFNLPVWHLEGLRGREARARARVLHRRAREHAVYLTVTCALLEMAVVFSLFGLIDLLTPDIYERNRGLAAIFSPVPDEPVWLSWLHSACYLAAVSVVEPLYVAAGFALYLNRRTQLEAWDLEVALRRLNERAAPAAPAASVGLAAGLVLLLALAGPPGAAYAAASRPGGAMEQIREVLKDKEFNQYREVRNWRYTGPGFTWESNDKRRKDDSRFDWENLGRFVAELMRALMWGLAGALIAAAVYYLARHWPRWRWAAASGRPAAPPVLFGMDIRPESLPSNVPDAARALLAGGRVREGLGLLYRGALSVLVHREQLDLGTGATENDCLRLVHRRCPPPTAAYLSRLVLAWQQAAYAERPPEPAAAAELCAGWAALLSPGTP